MTLDSGKRFLDRMMDWEFDPGTLPPSYHPDRDPSDLNLHYKDLFEDGEFDSPTPVAKHGTPGEPGYPHNPRNPRLSSAWATNSLDALFPDDAIRTTVPWPAAPRLPAKRFDYDIKAIQAVMAEPPVLTPIDPRTLSSRQPSLTRQGVRYYLEDPTYAQSGDVYADAGKKLNAYPTIYVREDGTNLILSGHHRAAAALIKGEMLQARIVHGPWPLRPGVTPS